MERKLNIICLAFLILLTLSCSAKNKPKNFDYGHIEDGKYVNSFFEFEVEIPSDWIVQTKEQAENISEMGKKLIAGDDNNMKAILKASEVNVANLLVVFRYEIGSPVDYNANFSLVAENLKNTPGIKTGSDYLFHARKLLKQSQVQYDFIDEEFESRLIDNQEFYIMNASISYAGMTIKQVYYTTVIDGFCLGAIISFVTDEHKAELEKTINSMKFKK